MRNRGYYRDVRKKAIERKERIINQYAEDNPPHLMDYDYSYNYGCEGPYTYKDYSTGNYYPYYVVKNKGYLAKGKIHCSCAMCSCHDTTMRSKKRLMSLNDALDDAAAEVNTGTLKNKIKKEINGRYYFHNTGYNRKTNDDVNYNEFKKILNDCYKAETVTNRKQKRRQKREDAKHRNSDLFNLNKEMKESFTETGSDIMDDTATNMEYLLPDSGSLEDRLTYKKAGWYMDITDLARGFFGDIVTSVEMSLGSWNEDEKEDALDSARGVFYDFYHSKYPKIDFGGESIIVKFINGKEIKIWSSEWAEITKNYKG